MSYLLELLGRGLLGDLASAFESRLPGANDAAAKKPSRRAAAGAECDGLLRRGTLALRDGRLAEAQEAFSDAMRVSKSPVLPAIGLACVRDELGRHEDALGCLTLAARHEPADPAILFSIAFCHERLGRTERAAHHYWKAIEACPRLRNAHERLAAIAILRRNLPEAISRYEALVDIEPDDMDLRMSLGALYLNHGRPEQAAAQFERALLIEPECADGAVEEAEEIQDEPDTREALASMEAFVKKYPGIPDFHVHLADLYVKCGQDAAAVGEYQAALKIQPNYLEATVKLGTQHLRCRRYLDAARTFNRAVELNDRLIAAHLGLALSQHAAGSPHEAQATFTLAASIEPNTTLLFSETARLQLRAFLAKALGSGLADADNGESANARQTVTQAGDEVGNLMTEQLRMHRQALALRPNDADLHYRHGLLLRQIGRRDDAQSAFCAAAEINPAFTRALIRLGNCQLDANDTQAAIATFQQAIGLREDAVDLQYELGLLFTQRAKFDLLVERAESETRAEIDPAVRSNLTVALQNLGLLDRSEVTWRSICNLSRQWHEIVADRADSADE